MTQPGERITPDLPRQLREAPPEAGDDASLLHLRRSLYDIGMTSVSLADYLIAFALAAPARALRDLGVDTGPGGTQDGLIR